MKTPFTSWPLSLKQTYHGKLTYAANWDDYKKFPFWEKLNYIGVDAYFPLSSDKIPSVNSLQKSWKKYIDEMEKISLKHNRQYCLPSMATAMLIIQVKNPGKK